MLNIAPQYDDIGIYRPRNPQAGGYFRCEQDHFEQLDPLLCHKCQGAMKIISMNHYDGYGFAVMQVNCCQKTGKLPSFFLSLQVCLKSPNTLISDLYARCAFGILGSIKRKFLSFSLGANSFGEDPFAITTARKL